MLRRPPELPRAVNDRLSRLATSVFTPTNANDFKRGNAARQAQGRIEIDYSSSLPLQMLLYFNVCFFPCWLLSLTFVLPVLAAVSSDPQNVILMVFAFVFKAVIELVRLYLGYAGNLAERMPELTAFCLLTIIFQIPLSVFLLIYPLVAVTGVKLALVAAVEIIYVVFLIFEAIFGISAVRIMVSAQSSRFHYRQFEEILSANDSPLRSG